MTCVVCHLSILTVQATMNAALPFHGIVHHFDHGIVHHFDHGIVHHFDHGIVHHFDHGIVHHFDHVKSRSRMVESSA